MNLVKRKFIKQLAQFLNQENELRWERNELPLDICFMVAPVESGLLRYERFVADIANGEYLFGDFEVNPYYGGSKSKLNIRLASANYHYELDFNYTDFLLGECRCQPHDPGYNLRARCCGEHCSWTVPTFSLTLIQPYPTFQWEHGQRAYWEYENTFNNHANYNAAARLQFLREWKKREIKNKITHMEKLLERL